MLKTHPARRRRARSSRACLGAMAALALSFFSSLALGAQNPPADQKPADSSSKQEKKEKPAPKPAEKGKEQPEPTPTLHLETPPPAQEVPKQAPQPAEKPAPETPQKLQLETPKEAPAAPKATEEAKPAAPAPGVEAAKPTIEEILFRGARRTPASTLRARIFSHPGDVYDESALFRDFMALWNTGFFDDIRLESADGKTGKIVTFYVAPF